MHDRVYARFCWTGGTAALVTAVCALLFERAGLGLWVSLLLAALAGGLAAALVGKRQTEQMVEGLLPSLKRVQSRAAQLAAGENELPIDCPAGDLLAPLAGQINRLAARAAQGYTALRAERERCEGLLDRLETGVALVGPQGEVTWLNSAMGKYFALPDHAKGMAIGQILPDPVLVQAVDQARLRGVSAVLNLSLGANGQEATAVRALPIPGNWAGAQAGTGVLLLFDNVSHDRQMERMRSEFLGNVSHELKTPITSIAGFSELLCAGVVTRQEDQQAYLQRIKRECDRMTALLDDILRLNRLDTLPEQPAQQLQLREVADEICESLVPAAASHQVQVQVLGGAVMWADREDMRQLLKNLMENAVKYNHPGGQVRVHLTGDQTQVTLKVEDTGIGIPLEHQGRVFERFYRVDQGRSKREGGTGLGLSIVKHVVARYRGQLSLDSRVGRGTVVRVIFPTGGQEEKMQTSAACFAPPDTQ